MLAEPEILGEREKWGELLGENDTLGEPEARFETLPDGVGLSKDAVNVAETERVGRARDGEGEVDTEEHAETEAQLALTLGVEVALMDAKLGVAEAELIALVEGGSEAEPETEASREALRLGLGEDDAEAVTETRVLGEELALKDATVAVAEAQLSALGEGCEAEAEMEGSCDSLRLGLGVKEAEVVAEAGREGEAHADMRDVPVILGLVTAVTLRLGLPDADLLADASAVPERLPEPERLTEPGAVLERVPDTLPVIESAAVPERLPEAVRLADPGAVLERLSDTLVVGESDPEGEGVVRPLSEGETEVENVPVTQPESEGEKVLEVVPVPPAPPRDTREGEGEAETEVERVPVRDTLPEALSEGVRLKRGEKELQAEVEAQLLIVVEAEEQAVGGGEVEGVAELHPHIEGEGVVEEERESVGDAVKVPLSEAQVVGNALVVSLWDPRSLGVTVAVADGGADSVTEKEK